MFETQSSKRFENWNLEIRICLEFVICNLVIDQLLGQFSEHIFDSIHNPILI